MSNGIVAIADQSFGNEIVKQPHVAEADPLLSPETVEKMTALAQKTRNGINDTIDLALSLYYSLLMMHMEACNNAARDVRRTVNEAVEVPNTTVIKVSAEPQSQTKQGKTYEVIAANRQKELSSVAPGRAKAQSKKQTPPRSARSFKNPDVPFYSRGRGRRE